jgi:chromosome segregation ATPase
LDMEFARKKGNDEGSKDSSNEVSTLLCVNQLKRKLANLRLKLQVFESKTKETLFPRNLSTSLLEKAADHRTALEEEKRQIHEKYRDTIEKLSLERQQNQSQIMKIQTLLDSKNTVTDALRMELAQTQDRHQVLRVQCDEMRAQYSITQDLVKYICLPLSHFMQFPLTYSQKTKRKEPSNHRSSV